MESEGALAILHTRKSWCGLSSRDKSKLDPYNTLRKQIKAYSTVLSWKPGSLTDDQLDSVVKFASSLPSVNSGITIIKTKHCQEDAVEVQGHLRHLVKDIGRKLQATMDHLYGSQAEDALNAEDTEPESRCPLQFTVRFAIRLVLNILFAAKCDWASPYFPRAIRLHIICWTVAPDTGHPFLNYSWCATDPREGIAWGDLGLPRTQMLLGVLKCQQIEQVIGYP